MGVDQSRPIDRFSLKQFKCLVNHLREVKVVDQWNKEFIVNILRSIVEFVIYGDKCDPMISEYFMESQIVAEFLRLLKISRNSRIESQLLHYLTIMIQNLYSEHAIYFCFSNEYINKIILHNYEFDVGDLAFYYISFLRAVVGKLNKDTICLLAKVQEDVVISFPLYTEAIKFACHEEKMIRIAVRALTLSIYNVRDDMVYEFMTTPPVSQYFSDLVIVLRERCFTIDILVSDRKDTCTNVRMNELLREIDEVTDDLSYCKDVLNVGNLCLSKLLMSNLLSILVVPILLPSLQLNQNLEGLSMSAITSLYILTRIVQIIGGQELVDTVGIGHKFPCGVLSYGGNMDFRAISSNELSEMQKILIYSLTPMHVIEENCNNVEDLFRCLSDNIFSSSEF